MTDYKLLACRQADDLLQAALNAPVPMPTRKGKGAFAANAAPKAHRLDGEAVLPLLSTAGTFFEEITLDNGFLNFHFGEAFYAAVLSMEPEKACPGKLPIAREIQSPAAVEKWDIVFLTALKGKPPHWSLAARQDRENPAWLVRYTARRLLEFSTSDAEIADISPEMRSLLCLAADYPAFSQGDARALAGFLHSLALRVWEVTPQRMPEKVRRCVGGVLRAGMEGFVEPKARQ